MTQEQKDLLLKDLCARLPYGVKCQCFDEKTVASLTGIKSNTELYFDELDYKELDGIIEITYCKPYLFPLLSMTEEQKEEEQHLKEELYSFDADGNVFTLQDFYHKNHIDFRGLIPMGLAIDVTNLDIY